MGQSETVVWTQNSHHTPPPAPLIRRTGRAPEITEFIRNLFLSLDPTGPIFDTSMRGKGTKRGHKRKAAEEPEEERNLVKEQREFILHQQKVAKLEEEKQENEKETVPSDEDSGVEDDTEMDLSKLTEKELESLCASKNIKVKGTKKDLIAALEKANTENTEALKKDDSENENSQTNEEPETKEDSEPFDEATPEVL